MPMDETIPALFARQASALADRPLFLVKRAGAYHSISWEEAARDVLGLSMFLLHHQVKLGDRVLILSENRPEWGIADLAIQSVGAWTVPIYPSLPAEEILTICRNCEPIAAIASTIDQVTKLLAISASLPSLHSIIVMDQGPRHDALLTPWAKALEKGREVEPRLKSFCEHRRSQIRPEHTATLLYTSGTTGEPKGVMLSHRNFLSNVQACLQVIPIHQEDLHLSFLPLCHVFERMAGWYLMLAVGARVAYAENMETIPQNMIEAHPTVMLGVPRFFEKLYARIQEGMRQASPLKRRLAQWAMAVGRRAASDTLAGRRPPLAVQAQAWLASHVVFKKLKARLGGRLRFFVSGSAPLSKDVGEFFFSLGVTILEGYGLTETSPVITVNRLPIPRFGSVGRTVPGVEVKMADDGEILTRGPHVMQGYYRAPEATAEVLKDGWFHTGDIGHLDAQGNLFITDRKKDLIKTAGGKFVAPQKLENLLITDPSIAQAFVYGDRQPYCVALLVPHMDQLRRWAQEQHITVDSMEALVRDPRTLDFYWSRVQAKQRGLASFEQIKKIALLDREFSQTAGELTPTLKAKRSIIAQHHAALLQELYQSAGPPAT